MFSTLFAIATIVATWKLFEKAGYDGWKALIPVYNLYILLKICRFADSAILWILIAVFCLPIASVMIIASAFAVGAAFGGGAIGYVAIPTFLSISLIALLPIASFASHIYIMARLAKAFGQSDAFTVGLVLLTPIFIMILGFGEAKYQGLSQSTAMDSTQTAMPKDGPQTSNKSKSTPKTQPKIGDDWVNGK